ncbi:type II toxin-antitoxin system RelE/ParE family toxin [uncultured Dialister sp.]|uniref:type II toxin-antitoxin system RelE/ParE family toxin n=1 Tax=uncultured Dialister sp. TaxID=278064 RepID=UPI0025EBBC15|nr:type II toxin-antitoxin system RelE/ParE family toxin [uncultured Dialister sp.]
MFKIIFYKRTDGSAPVEEFLDSLDVKMRKKAVDSLCILKEFGNRLREPHSKPVGDGLFELRIRFSNDIARIFYFFIIGNQIILTNGFIKKTQKTPKSELLLAQKYKDDYERRSHHG